jgi:hypothetical protein
MERLAFAEPLQATPICNNYNHVVQVISIALFGGAVVQAGAYGENYTFYGEYRFGSSKPMAEINSSWGEYAAIGDVRTMLINRCVNQPIWG